MVGGTWTATKPVDLPAHRTPAEQPSTARQGHGTMIGMKSIRVVIVVVIALVSVACSEVPASSGSAGAPTSTPTSTALATGAASAPPATPEPTPTPTPEFVFRALDLPAEYSRGEAEAVDGTTAVGWVQIGINDELPAVWDTTTGALRVLEVPEEFVHANGETYVRLDGVSGTTAVGKGVLGTGSKRGQDRAMAWDTQTGDLRILDIPDGFASDYTQTEADSISGTTAVGEVWARHGEIGAAVAWDTDTGAVRILESPDEYECVIPTSISGDIVVGTRCEFDEGLPLIWDPLTAEARDLDLLPSTRDGIPWAVDGTTVVGWCCDGEEGTPLPVIWDTVTGSVRQLPLPAANVYGTAVGVSGPLAIGHDFTTNLVWDLETDEVRVLPPPAGYEYFGMHAVSGRTIVGSACPPPPSSSENPRCVAAAWTLP